jgi:hypothetical protein
MPLLFAPFHPIIPTQVVHMDAMGMQLAVEAHFGNFDKAVNARDMLRADWSAIKAEVGNHVATCTRVQSVGTVDVEIEGALTMIDDAIVKHDGATAEQFGEYVLNLVDTLQRLFNCPVGNDAPMHGLGSRCRNTSDCDPDQVCDTTNLDGRCAPDPARFAIGMSCTGAVDCGNDHRVVCASEAGDNFPGGYCMIEPCDDIQLCPSGSTCVTLGAETPACMKSCRVDEDCRGKDGYICQYFSITPPIGFGPSAYACSFRCTRDADCYMPLTCDTASGKCKP